MSLSMLRSPHQLLRRANLKTAASKTKGSFGHPSLAITSPLIATRSYYATPLLCHALRRRSRRHSPGSAPTQGGNGGDDDIEDLNDDESRNRLGYNHVAVTDDKFFSASASALIDKLYKAIQPMERVNNPFFLTKGIEDDLGPFLLLDLGPLLGQYTIQVDLDQSLVTMTTPRSGQIAYILSQSTKEWVSLADGHVLEGMLVRELIHHAQGLPKL
jgi:hypothetical protein